MNPRNTPSSGSSTLPTSGPIDLTPTDPSDGTLAEIQEAIVDAAHLLPAQGPITVFVHHNTLHAFEHLPFVAAVRSAMHIYGCNPFLPEATYHAMLESGRIRPKDLEAVIAEDAPERGDEPLEVGETRSQLRLAMLLHPPKNSTDAELGWLLAGTDTLVRFRPETPGPVRHEAIENTRRWVMRHLEDGAAGVGEHMWKHIKELTGRFGDGRDWSDQTWESATLELLWQSVQHGLRGARKDRPGKDKRALQALVLEATGRDIDALISDRLIRFCAAFLDQGLANWPLPERDSGFFHSFLYLYSEGTPVDRWLSDLPAEVSRVLHEAPSALESIRESLDLLGLEGSERNAHINSTVWALRGFAGMLWQMETNAEWTKIPAPEGTLVGYVAIRLILERAALRLAAAKYIGQDRDLTHLVKDLRCAVAPTAPPSGIQEAFMVFQLARQWGWAPATMEALSHEGWAQLLKEVHGFSEFERRQTYHLAYERRYRIQALDGVIAHCNTLTSQAEPGPSPPLYQVVACIDDREESFRRHLEECDPECATLGVAGFFGVAMYYRGAHEAHFRPLCPVSIKPQHYIEEEAVYSQERSSEMRAMARRTLGQAAHSVHAGTRTLFVGILTGLLGSLATFPLVLRVLFPRSVALARKLASKIVAPPPTRLRLERQQDPAIEVSTGRRDGYDLDEMAAIVEGLLRSIGLISDFAELVVIVGHGSASLNNPHEAAYDCGACGGGAGGPNARAFSEMANDPQVRAKVAAQGLHIPDDVWFLGAYHNTCDDSMTYYDLDQLPAARRERFERARASLDKARARNALERCRRFMSASLTFTPEQALQHVEGRSEDLSQARPECGHATNAMCFVGRRSWSRGLFLDRRTFLTSYDPAQDGADSEILEGLLQAVIPVCAGINLEYYFSFVDAVGYGCGTKLPHNVTSMLGVMNGAGSDLRTGLPWQMVEIHEPVRILFLIECTPDALLAVLKRNPDMARLVSNEWVQIAVVNPDAVEIQVLRGGVFEPYVPESRSIPTIESSVAWYRGQREHLGFATVASGPQTEEVAR